MEHPVHRRTMHTCIVHSTHARHRYSNGNRCFPSACWVVVDPFASVDRHCLSVSILFSCNHTTGNFILPSNYHIGLDNNWTNEINGVFPERLQHPICGPMFFLQTAAIGLARKTD